MTTFRIARQALIAIFVAATAAGCGHAPLPTGVAMSTAKDWSGVSTLATHKPKRTPGRDAAEGGPDLSKLLCSADMEAKAPGAFILGNQAADFLKAEASKSDGERLELARRITGDSKIMGAFAAWDSQSADDKLATLKSISEIEGDIMGFTAPPMDTKTGVPQDGTMAYFMGAKDGIGSVTLFPEAIARGDKWAAIATVTHEMRHAYQFQLVVKASKHQVQAGSVDETLAYGFYQADMFINKMGGEDKFSYGDYCHLNNEWDAFATGNMVAAVVSKGQANTSGLGFVDVQFSAQGAPLVSLSQLAAKVGQTKLMDAINQAELKAIQGSK